MKFTCSKNILLTGITTAQKAVTGKSTMQILQGILINAYDDNLILTSSDKDLSIETIVLADVEENGDIVVDAKLFGDIVRKLPNDTITISTSENNSLKIVCQKSVFTLTYMNSSDFPEIPRITENTIFKISQKTLRNMIKGTIFATAQDETRPILTGVLFEIRDKKLNMVTLDGYRLALMCENIEDENTISAVIPGKTLNEVSKIMDDVEENINITFTPNHILFCIGVTKIISRLLEGEFIKYKSIIPEDFNSKITVNRNEILDCVERASLVGKEGNTNLIKLDIQENLMVITSNSQLGMVREEVNIILQGQQIQIAFNSKYLLDIFKIMEEEEVIMEFSSSVSPCIIKNIEKDNCIYLVLPVRVLK